jgi:hypothetical protein
LLLGRRGLRLVIQVRGPRIGWHGTTIPYGVAGLPITAVRLRRLLVRI